MTKLRLLLAEDSDDDVHFITDALRRHGMDCAITRVMTAKDFRDSLDSADWDLILCDFCMPGFDAMEALEIVGATGRDIPFIIISGTVGEEVAVETLKHGANDYILKENLTRLGPAVEHELRDAEERRQRRLLEAFTTGQGEVLEQILENRPLNDILAHIVRRIEALPLSASRPRAAILLVNAEGSHLEMGSAPSLPAEFRRLIEEGPIPLREGMGSSSAAVLARRPAVTDDIATHPDWEHVRHLVAEHNLRSCWSVPVFSSDDAVLGTIAIYHDNPRSPDESELKWVEAAGKLVTLAVERSRTARALRYNESLVAMAGEIALVGGWDIDLINNSMVWSDEVCAIHEVPPGSRFSPDDGIAFYAPEYRDRIRKVFDTCVRQGKPFDEELQIITATGRRAWIRTIGQAVRDRHGNIVRVRGAFQDITERKEATQEVRRLAQRLTTILESITDAFFTLDREWRFTYLNPEAERLLHRSAGELMNKVVWDEFQSAVGSAFEREYRRALEDNVTVQFEEYYPPLETWFEVHAYPSEEGLAVYFHDITDRKQNEKKLAEQAALLDKAQDAILVRDLSGTVRFWNKSAERLYGWTADEATGADVRSLIYQDPATFEAANRKVISLEEWSGELSQVRKGGEPLIVRARWSLVRDENGEPSAILAINTDITEAKRMEQQFLRAQRMEGIGTLAGGIAHDLNNLLSPILMATELLQQGELSPEDLTIVNTIASNARRGADMIRQVLSFARGASGERIPTPPKHLISELVRMISGTFPRNIEIQTEISENIGSILGDPTQIHQALLNLCINARDAMPEGGVLTIRATDTVLSETFIRRIGEGSPGAHVLVEVKDTGTGIPEKILPRIFDPFFTTKEPGQGTGLGLATVMSIMRGHQGIAQIESEPDRGTVFQLYFPAANRPGSAESPSRLASLPHGSNETILVIDDEAAIRDITRRTLETFGYRVLLASDGAEGLASYRAGRADIDLVLTDMMMPVMDGLAMIRAIRETDASIPIIASSGINSRERDARSAGMGTSAFLQKPYSTEQLLTAVHRALHGQQESPASNSEH